jgi:hypothetical protein
MSSELNEERFKKHYLATVKRVLELEEEKKRLQEIVMGIQADFVKMQKDIFGLKACLKEDELDCFEMGKEDKTFADKVDKQLSQNDDESLHQRSDMEKSLGGNKDGIPY